MTFDFSEVIQMLEDTGQVKVDSSRFQDMLKQDLKYEVNGNTYLQFLYCFVK